MRILVGVLIALIFAFVFKIPLKRAPVVFYLIAVALDVLLIYGTFVSLPLWLWRSLGFWLQKNVIAFGLFSVVMFIGVLNKNSKLFVYLMPIRAELSILACLLALGHVIVFVYTYYLRISMYANVMSGFQIVAVICSTIFLLMMIPLLITSFKFVHRHINTKNWKHIQFLAYPFYLLLFAHIFLFLGPTLAPGGDSMATVINVVAYAFICLLYIVLRLRKRALDKRAYQVSRPLSQTD